MRPDYRYMCLRCFSELGNEWQKRNPERSARHKRNSNLIKRVGITLEESERLLIHQGGLCAVCKQTIKLPHVDHDHASNEVRGILCFNCNSGLGSFKDNIQILMAAIDYLKCPPSRTFQFIRDDTCQLRSGDAKSAASL
jgi:hypothetical protein